MYKIEVDVGEVDTRLALLSENASKSAARMGLRRTMRGVSGDVARLLKPHLAPRLAQLRKRVRYETNVRRSGVALGDLFTVAHVGTKPEHAAHFNPRLRRRKGRQVVTVDDVGTRRESGGWLWNRGKNTNTKAGAILIRRKGPKRGPLEGMLLRSPSEVILRAGKETALLARMEARFRDEMGQAFRFAVRRATGEIVSSRGRGGTR
jgi:hypothetical protein